MRHFIVVLPKQYSRNSIPPVSYKAREKSETKKLPVPVLKGKNIAKI